jgi:hypothetical protein
MSTKRQTGSKEVAQQTAWLRSLRQAPAAFLLGIQTRQLRDYADAPRNEDGTYPARELVEWWANRAMGKVVQLSPDDEERAMQSLGAFNRPDDFYQALTEFVDRVERQQGDSGVLAIVAVWRAIWADHAKHLPGCADDDLIDDVSQCTFCGAYRWGLKWERENPRPDLEVSRNNVCPKCLEKKTQ